MDKSTVTPQVRRLETAGLVTRDPDPSDGRAALLSATAAGRAAHAEIAGRGAEIVDQLTAGWPAEDRRELGRLMDRLAAEFGPAPGRRTVAGRLRGPRISAGDPHRPVASGP